MGFPDGQVPVGLVSCAQLATVPAFGRCPAGTAAVKFPAFHVYNQDLATTTWPAAGVPAQRLDRLRLYSLNLVTNGSAPAVEQARTVLENAYPRLDVSPRTLGEDTASRNSTNNAYQQLADVVILASLAIAGCTLARASPHSELPETVYRPPPHAGPERPMRCDGLIG